jgi:hypothetical protein
MYIGGNYGIYLIEREREKQKKKREELINNTQNCSENDKDYHLLS